MRWLRGSLRYIIWSPTIVLTGLILWACYGPHHTTTRELLILLSIFLRSHVAAELVSARLQLEARYYELALRQLLPHYSRFVTLAALTFMLTLYIFLVQLAFIYAVFSL